MDHSKFPPLPSFYAHYQLQCTYPNDFFPSKQLIRMIHKTQKKKLHFHSICILPVDLINRRAKATRSLTSLKILSQARLSLDSLVGCQASS
ncbi:hypothetical protein EUGRSUZ_A00086 [Eucalyptus grandis]|uniref:Uncharacterized protein n=2 Tax=Eucalyptus grandis TaxID=71139 RepID=A0ACC3LZM9_EUCGR|nr:hypothetical protein EUGRSUZ_A00086 [Eucalyptus grandis]